MNSLPDVIFWLDVLILLTLLAGATWSLVSPRRRLWPPPRRGSWQHRLTWIFFYLVFGLNAGLLVLDWNTWIFASSLRFMLGIPLTLLGTLFVVWGIQTLGLQNTSGLQGGFVSAGPYHLTRNPQYLGDILLFIGLSLMANSLFLWITHILTILVFLVSALAEETWLEGQYGQDYIAYRRGTPRFL